MSMYVLLLRHVVGSAPLRCFLLYPSVVLRGPRRGLTLLAFALSVYLQALPRQKNHSNVHCAATDSKSAQFRLGSIGEDREQIAQMVVREDVAQMVERSLCMREVQGSIPCFSSEIMLP
ncbi:hypothetical protein DD237_008505 [Peronospora effusa]|uniref:Uncharacterized protein n=1 Tax=Peronospora effusa TaxID=542832 RepID=A0A3R8D1E6_9STRA|nr:hypothetical protein DD237_008505 [Peronospora effusa]